MKNTTGVLHSGKIFSRIRVINFVSLQVCVSSSKVFAQWKKTLSHASDGNFYLCVSCVHCMLCCPAQCVLFPCFLVFLPTISDRNAFCLLNVMFSVYFHLWQKKHSGDKSLVGDVSFSFCNFTLSSVLFSLFFCIFLFASFVFIFFVSHAMAKTIFLARGQFNFFPDSVQTFFFG